MNLRKYTSFFIVISLLIIFGFFSLNNITFSNKIGGNQIHFVKIDGQTLKVDLATTPGAQAQGLSGRKSLAEGEGMLFVFPKPSKYFFWMKNMNFPIDIIWLDANQKIIYLKKDALPELFPETYGPEKNSLYVLEVKALFTEKNNSKLGDKVEFLP